MNIPTEYYEEDFLEFENYINLTTNLRPSSKQNPHEKSDYYLEKYKQYEKFMKKENQKLFKRKKNAQKKTGTGQSNVLKEKTTVQDECSTHKDAKENVKVHYLPMNDV